VRVAIYARVSSAAQRDAQTIESQLHVLRPFVKRHGWTLVGEYIDDGRSAKTGQLERRDGFARLTVDAKARKFDALVVVDVDRLTRTTDMIERAAILGPFQQAGVDIVTPSGGRFDLDSMMGGLYVELQARFAAEENRKRADRVKSGKLRAIAEGRKPAGPTPYGWTYDRATGQWSVNEPAAAIVREIYRRVIAGESCIQIADDLHIRGERPPRKEWRRHLVWQIVRKRTAVGEWTADKVQRSTLRIPPIVDEATWQAAQDALLAHGKRGLIKARHIYLLQGLATCGMCGEPMSIRSPINARKGPPAYVCRARKLDLRHAARCRSPIVSVPEVDERVWAVVSRALVSQQLADAIARRFAARDENHQSWVADVQRYEARLAQIDRASAAIMARFRRGLIAEDALDLELAASAKERRMVAASLDSARSAVAGAGEPQASAGEWLDALRALGQSASPLDRQRVVRALVRRGGAVFVERTVEVDLEIDEPAVVFPALAAGSRKQHGKVRLRLVA
jgi:site-specific DNA recombinase